MVLIDVLVNLHANKYFVIVFFFFSNLQMMYAYFQKFQFIHAPPLPPNSAPTFLQLQLGNQCLKIICFCGYICNIQKILKYLFNKRSTSKPPPQKKIYMLYTIGERKDSSGKCSQFCVRLGIYFRGGWHVGANFSGRGLDILKNIK